MAKALVTNESGVRVRTDLIRRAVDAALPEEGSVGILLADDEALRRLNRTHRNQDEATDVLTFPSPDWARESLLGEIAISIDFARRGAQRRGVSLSQETAYLALHGALHLAGLDDQTDEDRAEMVRRMNQAAERAGLKPDLDWHSMPHGE